MAQLPLSLPAPPSAFSAAASWAACWRRPPSRLGFDVVDPGPARPNSPAGRVSRQQIIVAAYDDPDALEALGRPSRRGHLRVRERARRRRSDLLAVSGAAVAPGPKALAVAQDRVGGEDLPERRAARRPWPSPPSTAADDRRRACARIGAPALLKTRREGYDGKGQGWVALGRRGRGRLRAPSARAPAILEAHGRFRARAVDHRRARPRRRDRRLSAGREPPRGRHPAHAPSPPPRCAATPPPRPSGSPTAILDGLDYVGVIGVELFELARRHAAGQRDRAPGPQHRPLDPGRLRCATSSSSTSAPSPAGRWARPTPIARVEMINLLGDEVDDWPDLSAEPDARLHLYGKGEARPGRKMGHVNRVTGAVRPPRLPAPDDAQVRPEPTQRLALPQRRRRSPCRPSTSRRS